MIFVSLKYGTSFLSEVNSFSSKKSDLEQAILHSKEPINLNTTADDEIYDPVLGIRGIWTNRQEALNWKGPLKLEDYKYNEGVVNRFFGKTLL